MKVYGIVVSYNSAADLPMSLGSLQRLPVSRTIVVDNSSTDASPEIALRYTSDLLKLPNVGFGKAVNAAVEYAPDADAYLVLNPDCALSPEDYAPLRQALEADPRLGVVAPLMRYPDGRLGISSGPEASVVKEWLAALRVDHLVPRRLKSALLRSPMLRRRIPMLDYLDTGPSDPIREVAWVCGFCMFIRATAFRGVGGFDRDFFLYFEDVDFCKRLRAHNWKVASVGTSIADHRESTSTLAVGKNPLYRSGMVVYFSKHGKRVERLLAKALRRFPL